MTTPHEPRPTSVYRLFDAKNRLLYVGVGGNPGRRFEQHRTDKPWWGHVHHLTLAHYPTREAALAAELTAIRAEHPIHNIAGRSSLAAPPIPDPDPGEPAIDRAFPYPRKRLWDVRNKRGGTTRTCTLRLVYELSCDPISDDYYGDEISAEDLWAKYVKRYANYGHDHYGYPEGVQHIFWYVSSTDGGVFESAPYQTWPPVDLWKDGDADGFLTHYYVPEDHETGERLQFSRLPVQRKTWTSERANKGGFISQATGWTPSPMQATVNLRHLAEQADLHWPTERRWSR